MHACVARQLGVERGDEEATVAQQHRHAVVTGEHLDVDPGVGHPRRSDEDAPQRLGLAVQMQVGLEARELPAVAVPLDLDVDEPEVSSVEQDHPGAGAEHGSGELPDGVLQAVEPHQAHDRRRLAAGDHEPVEAVQLFRQPHLDHVGAERAQHRRVLAEVPLHSEDADRHA